MRKEDELRKKVRDISDFAKQKIRATSIEKDEPPVVETTGEKHAVLGVQQLDHVFAIRNQVFGENANKVAKLELALDAIQVQDITENPISDHAPLHVTYKISDRDID